jgi:hypothetical protein
MGLQGASPVRSPKDDVWHLESTSVDSRSESLMDRCEGVVEGLVVEIVGEVGK